MATSLFILTFHALDDQSSAISFSPELFERSMAGLNEKGYRTVRLLEVGNCLLSRKAFPGRSFAITFDDGYESVYQEAFPVLQRYHLSATIFLAVGGGRNTGAGVRLPSLEGRAMLRWQEIREMHRFGVEFGAHTCTHPNLTKLSPMQIDSEMADSKKIIEDGLGSPVRSFAYPYGRYNPRVRETARSYFACACSDRLGFVRFRSDAYALERVEMYYFRNSKIWERMRTGLFPWYLMIRKVPRLLRRQFQSG